MYNQTKVKNKIGVDWSLWHNYDHDTVQKNAPVDAGVYVLSTKLKDGKLRIFYIGQTDNIDRRLKEHLSSEEQNKCIKNEVSKFVCKCRWATIPLQSNRDKAERALYLKFKPECNDPDHIPDVEDCEINF